MHLAEQDLWVHTLLADRLREADRARLAAEGARPRPRRLRGLAGRALLTLGGGAQAAGRRLLAGSRSGPPTEVPATGPRAVA